MVALRLRRGPHDYTTYTYAGAASLARSLGFFFLKQGIKRGDRVAIILENRPEWPLFYFGALCAAATAVPIDPQLTDDEIQNLIADSGAKVVITKANADEILKNLEGAPQGFNFPATDVDAVASLLYTSGTTSQPKGVELTHRNFSGNFNSVNQLQIINKDDNILALLPLHHSYPFMVTLVLPLLVGSSVTYVRTLKPEEMMAAMTESGVTILVAVPQLLYLLHKSIFEKIKAVPLPMRVLLGPVIARKARAAFGEGLRFFLSGGARLDPAIARGLSRLGFVILEGYGLTETSPVATFNPVRRQKFGSVGIPVPDVQIRIADPDAAGAGEILIKGPNVMKGYYKREAETAEVIKDGWFYSGDVGYRDRDGYLFITGRKKEIIVLSSGKNIYPEEIEAHYRKSLFVKEMCVFGVLREGVTEELAAVIVPAMEHFRKIGEVNIREKLKWDLETFSKALPSYKRIMGFAVSREDLPRTRLGKIKRYEVEEAWRGRLERQQPADAGREPADEDASLLDSDVGRHVASLLSRQRNMKRPVRQSDHLELDLGVDSLGRVELAIGLEKLFQVKVAEAQLAQAFTVRDVIERVTQLIAGKGRGEAKLPGLGGGDRQVWPALLNDDPPQPIKEKIDLSPGILSAMATFFGIAFLRSVFALFFRRTVIGRENIPRAGPFVLCPNHSSYFDGLVVASSVPLRCELGLFFVGFRAYFMQPVIRHMIRLMRVIPLDPAAELVNAMQASSYVLRNNRSLCIFPEGQRSIDGDVKTFKKGIGILAKELNATLVPVCIEGAFEAWPRGTRFPRPHPVRVTFGKPLDHRQLLTIGRELGAQDDYEAIAAGLREAVLTLKKR